MATLFHGFRPALLVDVPLTSDPGTHFEYSILTSHLIDVIVARACDTDLKSLAQGYSFRPQDIEMGKWIKDWEGYYNGHADLHLRARDMAQFSLLCLNDGGPTGWGDHRYNLAWSHSSQQIAVLDKLNMVIVVTADPLFVQHDPPRSLKKRISIWWRISLLPCQVHDERTELISQIINNVLPFTSRRRFASNTRDDQEYERCA